MTQRALLNKAGFAVFVTEALVCCWLDKNRRYIGVCSVQETVQATGAIVHNEWLFEAEDLLSLLSTGEDVRSENRPLHQHL